MGYQLDVYCGDDTKCNAVVKAVKMQNEGEKNDMKVFSNHQNWHFCQCLSVHLVIIKLGKILGKKDKA